MAGSSDDFQNMEVDLGTMGAFATNVQNELESFTNSFSTISDQLTKNVFFENSGFNEAKMFQQYHAFSQEAASLFATDVKAGLNSLANAALSIRLNYSNGDAEASATFDDVLNSFTAPAAETATTTTPDSTTTDLTTTDSESDAYTNDDDNISKDTQTKFDDMMENPPEQD